MSDQGDALGPGVLATDAVTVRALRAEDLAPVARIDERITGRHRYEYYTLKISAALRESGVKISLIAELDDRVVGFLLGSVYYGEFGRPEPVAIIDTLGVDPDCRGRHVGAALIRQLTMNLHGLGIEAIETQVDWEQGELLGFLRRHGFRPIPRLALRRQLR